MKEFLISATTSDVAFSLYGFVLMSLITYVINNVIHQKSAKYAAERSIYEILNAIESVTAEGTNIDELLDSALSVAHKKFEVDKGRHPKAAELKTMHDIIDNKKKILKMKQEDNEKIKVNYK